jgi:hypothetical protein
VSGFGSGDWKREGGEAGADGCVGRNDPGGCARVVEHGDIRAEQGEADWQLGPHGSASRTGMREQRRRWVTVYHGPAWQ